MSNKNILECIKIVRCNQNSIEKEDYHKLLSLLYSEISNNISLTDDLKDLEDLTDDLKKTVINRINYKELNFKSIDDFKNYQYKEELINEFKLLEYLLEDKKINYDFQINPIILEHYDKNIEKELNQKIKFMINFIGNLNLLKHRIILFLLIIDLIFKNFNIIIENKKFGEIVLNKIKENKIMTNIDIKNEIENINDIYENWIEIIENFNFI